MASTAKWAAIGALLAAVAVVQAHGLCRVVTHKTLAERTDDQGRQLYLAAVIVVNLDDDDDDDDGTASAGGAQGVIGDREDDSDGATAWATASWVDSAQRHALRRTHRPGTIVPCAGARAIARGVNSPPPPPPRRSEPGAGPRIAALCAAAAAVGLVLGCGMLACALKTECCRRVWRRHSHAAWDDNDDIAAHRLVDSVFG
ncbi:hypothetical protein pdul_cds_645 [Pandoravirus dulcis]|uniref:Uncharacterized protein n=1 Tax=Pandoravirus dulcis TaxID=1349409 RepID=S4VR77_9VIRU|nr:hypothetical protein pdul_cds_645 [Pandoravirus dulcis]AGO82787.1 hypothetical protein pdul_cds_645 [Pandoravirus dulcis]